MKRIQSIKQLINQVNRFNELSLNKPKVILIESHADTWKTLVKDKIYLIKKCMVKNTAELPLNVIKTRKWNVKTKEAIILKRVTNLTSIMDMLGPGESLTMHPSTYEKIKGISKTPVLMFDKSDFSIQTKNWVPEGLILVIAYKPELYGIQIEENICIPEGSRYSDEGAKESTSFLIKPFDLIQFNGLSITFDDSVPDFQLNNYKRHPDWDDWKGLI